MSRAVGLARSRNFANCSARSIPLRRGFQRSLQGQHEDAGVDPAAPGVPGEWARFPLERGTSIPPRRRLGLAGPLRRAAD